jgi:hypothetical protein
METIIEERELILVVSLFRWLLLWLVVSWLLISPSFEMRPASMSSAVSTTESPRVFDLPDLPRFPLPCPFSQSPPPELPTSRWKSSRKALVCAAPDWYLEIPFDKHHVTTMDDARWEHCQRFCR